MRRGAVRGGARPTSLMSLVCAASALCGIAVCKVLGYMQGRCMLVQAPYIFLVTLRHLPACAGEDEADEDGAEGARGVVDRGTGKRRKGRITGAKQAVEAAEEEEDGAPARPVKLKLKVKQRH